MCENLSRPIISPAWQKPAATRDELTRAQVWRAVIGALGLFWIVLLMAIIG